MLSNYTQDLLFSMERLSSSPYAIKRLNPAKNTLPFLVDDSIVSKLSGSELKSLFSAGRLFYVDYSSQAKFTPIDGRYAAACEAYFFIHPKSGDFLPLAIKPNGGSSLIYTPLDEPNDWLLAKMMFEENDLWGTAWYHLATTHYPVGLVLEAAVRTLSDDHPVLAILNRG
jgi:arachidonate 15-lipoxygenase (second type) / 8-lipoxygenase (S-type)